MRYQDLLFCAIIVAILANDEVEVINSISEHIGHIVLECKSQIGFKNDVVKDFLVFWNPTFELTNNNLGCAAACILKNLEVLQKNGQLKKDNSIAFLKANGADSSMSSKIMELTSLCISAVLTKRPTNRCALGLEIFKCFRYGVFRLHWAPHSRKD